MTPRRAGTLVLVVGASGAGKDTILRGAQHRLAADARVLFPRRYITRAPDLNEDHITLTPAAFAEHQARGAFGLRWSAHGLDYALPATIDADLAAGRVVVCNVSRTVIDEARGRHQHVLAVEIRASTATRARRLAERGREEAADVATRLERRVDVAIDAVIDNDGTPQAAIDSFVTLLRAQL